MSVGLIALLDDVAAIAKVAAASLDNVATQAAKAGMKAAGVVIDDAAVTPRYVVGFAAQRELPIVGKIAAEVVLFFNGGKLDTNSVSEEATVVRAWVRSTEDRSELAVG